MESLPLQFIKDSDKLWPSRGVEIAPVNLPNSSCTGCGMHGENSHENRKTHMRR